MAKTMSEAERRRRRRLNRRTSGWAESDYGTARKVIAYWRARMDRLRVGDVMAELGELEERSRHLAKWLEKVERAGTVPSEYAKEALGRLAQHERVLAERFKALREKLGWCF